MLALILYASNAGLVQAQHLQRVQQSRQPHQDQHLQRNKLPQQAQHLQPAQQAVQAQQGQLEQDHPQPTLSAISSSCNNYISITGETNINHFSLDQFVPGDLICGVGDSRWIKLPEDNVYLIRVPVRNFEASNRMVYRDFLELIDVIEHPFISIFIEETEFELLFQDRSYLRPRIGITVAGATRYYNVPCRVAECVDGKIAVSGQKTLKLTDFKLAPPKKTMGLIRVQNELIINFEFSLPSESGIKLSKI